MYMLGMLAVISAVTSQEGAIRDTFERFKERLVGIWSFVEEGKSYDTTFEAVSHGKALLERTPVLLPYITATTTLCL